MNTAPTLSPMEQIKARAALYNEARAAGASDEDATATARAAYPVEPAPTAPSTHAGRPHKLASGAWGVRIVGPNGAVKVGDKVTVTTHGGKSWSATVTVIWSYIDGGTICATQSADRPAPTYTPMPARKVGAAWQPCGYPGCSPSYCDECDGEGATHGRRGGRRW